MPNVQHTLCSHPVLAAYKYSCSYYKDWVIAFRITDKELIVCDIIYGSLLFQQLLTLHLLQQVFHHPWEMLVFQLLTFEFYHLKVIAGFYFEL